MQSDHKNVDSFLVYHGKFDSDAIHLLITNTCLLVNRFFCATISFLAYNLFIVQLLFTTLEVDLHTERVYVICILCLQFFSSLLFIPLNIASHWNSLVTRSACRKQQSYNELEIVNDKRVISSDRLRVRVTGAIA